MRQAIVWYYFNVAINKFQYIAAERFHWRVDEKIGNAESAYKKIGGNTLRLAAMNHDKLTARSHLCQYIIYKHHQYDFYSNMCVIWST